MIYAQINSGQKLHLAYQPGEGYKSEIVRAGYLSLPLCGIKMSKSSYRININLPLGSACKNCTRIAKVRSKK
jgi:hypothetical protein